MRNGVSPGLHAIARVMLGLLAATSFGCEGDPAPAPTGIRLDLESCVAEADGPETCRGRLASAAGAGACLVVVPGGDVNRHQSLAMTWQGGRLVPADPSSSLNLAAGEAFEASLFTLSAAGDCAALELRSPCTVAAGCVTRYGPVGHSVGAGDATRIHFLVDGVCEFEQAAGVAETFVEACGDGVDNDCDNAVDESLSGPCFVGVGACRREGTEQICREGGYACDAVPGSPEADVDCDGIDDDCDELIDEAGECDTCIFDNECLATPETPQCVGDRCAACDPETGEGCGPDAPICDGSPPMCRGCEGAECGAGRVCLQGVCRACDPDPNSGTCTDAEAPACDGDTFECRPCRDGAECLSGICFTGRCATCDPSNNAGCLAPDIVCDRNQLECRTCLADAECAAVNPDQPVCREGECVECNIDGNDGCSEPAQPICVIDPPGAPPRCAPCTLDDECRSGSCRNGRCVGCDPIDNSGCEPLGGQPVCDDGEGGENAFCRPCATDLECPGGLGRGICTVGACRECDDVDARGCDEAGEEPICDSGQCRICAGDGECALRPGRLDLCVDNRCAVCDPATNRGCDEAAAPVCRNGACRACAADAECGGGLQCVGGRCTVCDPADNAGCGGETPICGDGGAACEPCGNDRQCDGDRLCVAGRCVECEPGNNRGCEPGGVTPICSPQTATCGRCANDGECTGRQCLPDGRCAECDPADNEGCDGLGARPICGADGACRRCGADADCADRGLSPICDLATGTCRVCTAGDNRGCDPGSQAPICEAGACRGCLDAGECGEGLLCRDGRCQGCSEQGNVGCEPDGAAPICVDGNCQPCNADVQCQDPQRTYCYDGRCTPCDPDDGLGCDALSDRPFCLRGECRPCADADQTCSDLDPARGECLADGRCGPCDPQDNSGCDNAGIAPVCDVGVLFCRACNRDDECNFGNCQLEAGGRCVTCDPEADDTGCDLTGGRPVCDRATLRCVPCVGDGECVGNPQGETCRDGACGCTDSGDCGADENRPICASFTSNTCRACNNNAECGAGMRCRGGRCQPR